MQFHYVWIDVAQSNPIGPCKEPETGLVMSPKRLSGAAVFWHVSIYIPLLYEKHTQ